MRSVSEGINPFPTKRQNFKNYKALTVPIQKDRMPFSIRSFPFKLFCNCLNRTCSCTSSAADASALVDYVSCISFRNSTYRTSICTSTTLDASIANLICHLKYTSFYPLYTNRASSVIYTNFCIAKNQYMPILSHNFQLFKAF